MTRRVCLVAVACAFLASALLAGCVSPPDDDVGSAAVGGSANAHAEPGFAFVRGSGNLSIWFEGNRPASGELVDHAAFVVALDVDTHAPLYWLLMTADVWYDWRASAGVQGITLERTGEPHLLETPYSVRLDIDTRVFLQSEREIILVGMDSAPAGWQPATRLSIDGTEISYGASLPHSVFVAKPCADAAGPSLLVEYGTELGWPTVNGDVQCEWSAPAATGIGMVLLATPGVAVYRGELTCGEDVEDLSQVLTREDATSLGGGPLLSAYACPLLTAGTFGVQFDRLGAGDGGPEPMAAWLQADFAQLLATPQA